MNMRRQLLALSLCSASSASALATLTFASTYRWMIDGAEINIAAISGIESRDPGKILRCLLCRASMLPSPMPRKVLR